MLVVMLALFTAGIFYANYQLNHLIVPGVSVGNTPLGGMSVQDAAVELHRVFNMEQRIVISDGIHDWEATPAEIGLRLDAWQTANRAYAVAHGLSIPAELGQMVYSLHDGWQVTPVIELDSARAQAWLESIRADASQSPVDAQLVIKNGELTATQGQIGYAVNTQATLDTIQSDPAAVLLKGSWQVALMPIPPQVSDATSTLAQAKQLLETPFVIQAYDPIDEAHYQWQVEKALLASWLVVQPGDGGASVSIDPLQVQAYLDTQSSTLGDGKYLDSEGAAQLLVSAFSRGETPTLQVRHQPLTYHVQKGDTLLKISWYTGIPFWMILQANPGLDPDRLLAGQSLTIPSQDDLLPLPVVPGKRIVISISRQRLWVYQDGKLLSKHKISTGIDRSPTQPGIFQVQTHDRRAYASVWDLTMPYFLGIYEAWPGFMNGLHGLPTLSNGQRLWGNILGRPASFGCIILDLETAERLYHWAENGVVVEIQP